MGDDHLYAQLPQAKWNKKGLPSLADTNSVVIIGSQVPTEIFQLNLHRKCQDFVNQGCKITSLTHCKIHDKTPVF